MASVRRREDFGEFLDDIENRMPLARFRETEMNSAVPLTPDALAATVDTAQHLLTGLYAHLPLKRAAYAVNPQQQLMNLRARIELLDPDKPLDGVAAVPYHQELLAIFNGLHDLHTAYVLPEPWRSTVAFLPFMVEEYWRDQADPKPVRVISKAVAAADETLDRVVAALRDGKDVLIQRWNGVPLDRLLEREAARNAGSNESASAARALDTLTWRWMGTIPLPDEDSVQLDLDIGGKQLRLDIEWQSGEPPTPIYDADCPPVQYAFRIGQDMTSEHHRQLRRALFRRTRTDKRDSPEAAATEGDSEPFFRWRKLAGGFGYIRIWTFQTEDAQAFIEEFLRVVEKDLGSPRGGLVIDIRGNPGGNVDAGEMLLQLLTPNRIAPAQLQFLNTGETLAFSSELQAGRKPGGAAIAAFAGSIKEGLRNGAQYSRGLPSGTAAEYNDRGQLYDGPVVLLVDGLSYSTSDLVAAGFEDNEVGEVIGTARTTGGGGAICIRYDCLRRVLVELGTSRAARWPDLPDGVGTFQVALQRYVRVGPDHAGELIEDRGVTLTEVNVHKPLRADIFDGNKELIAKAVFYLKRPLSPRGRLTPTPGSRGSRLELKVEKVATLQLVPESGPAMPIEINSGVAKINARKVPRGGARLEGYDKKGNLVVARRLTPSSR